MKQTYTKAILELLNSGEKPEVVLGGAKKVMSERGHEALFGTVLQNVLRVLNGQDPTTVVIVSSQDDVKKYKSSIAEALEELDSQNDPEVLLDETLIGGFVVENNHKRIDRSYKTALKSLYKNVVETNH